MSLVGKNTLLGTEVEIHASEHGTWSIQVPAVEGDAGSSQIGSGDTLDKAEGQARTALAKRKVKVHVEFISLSGQRGVATGLHARNGSVLVRFDDGSTEQLGYRSTMLRPDIPPETLKELADAAAEVHRLTTRSREIQKEYGFDVAPVVQRAIDEKVLENERSHQ